MPKPSRKMPAGLRAYWAKKAQQAKTATRRTAKKASAAVSRAASVIVYKPTGTQNMPRKKSARKSSRSSVSFARRSASRSYGRGRGGFVSPEVLKIGAGVVGGILLNTQVTPIIRSRFNIGTGNTGALLTNAAVATLVAAPMMFSSKTRAIGIGVAIGSIGEMTAGFVRGTIAKTRANQNTPPNTTPAVTQAAFARPLPPARPQGVAGFYSDDTSLSGLGRLASYHLN